MIKIYHKLNQKIVRNIYPFPRRGEMIQQLEGLKYDMSLDLSLGYYTIQIFLRSLDSTNNVTEFGKFGYNRVSMGLCASRDNFQAELDQNIVDTKEVKTYIINILVLGKGIFPQHIDQLKSIFDRLCNVGLKFNVPECIFG